MFIILELTHVCFNVSLSLIIIKMPTMSKALWQGPAVKSSMPMQFSTVKNIALTTSARVLIRRRFKSQLCPF
jgi:hypothetical protein